MRRVTALSVMNTAFNVLIIVGLGSFDVSTGAITLSVIAVVLPVMLLVMKCGVGARTWMSAGFVLAGVAVAVFPAVGPPQFGGFAMMLASCVIRALRNELNPLSPAGRPSRRVRAHRASAASRRRGSR